VLPGRSLAHPPGASQTGGASTTRSIDGRSLHHDRTHRPSCAPKRDAAGDALFRPTPGRTPAAAVRPALRANSADLPPRPRRSANRPPSPESRPGSRRSGSLPLRRHIGCPMPVPPRPHRPADPASIVGDPRPGHPPKRAPLPEWRSRLPVARLVEPLDAVHADPVSQVVALAPPGLVSNRTVGVSCSRPSRNFVTRLAGCPAGRATKHGGFMPRPEPLCLVERTRERSASLRRAVLSDPVVRSRSACAFRYVHHCREWETPGQEVFSNPQGYPLNFSGIPRNSSLVHRSCTGASTVFPTVVHRRVVVVSSSYGRRTGRRSRTTGDVSVRAPLTAPPGAG